MFPLSLRGDGALLSLRGRTAPEAIPRCTRRRLLRRYAARKDRGPLTRLARTRCSPCHCEGAQRPKQSPGARGGDCFAATRRTRTRVRCVARNDKVFPPVIARAHSARSNPPVHEEEIASPLRGSQGQRAADAARKDKVFPLSLRGDGALLSLRGRTAPEAIPRCARRRLLRRWSYGARSAHLFPAVPRQQDTCSPGMAPPPAPPHTGVHSPSPTRGEGGKGCIPPPPHRGRGDGDSPLPGRAEPHYRAVLQVTNA